MMILGRLSSSGGLTLTELSSDLEQSPTTVYRVLSTLAQREIVELVCDVAKRFNTPR